MSKLIFRRPIPWRDGFDAMVKLFDTEGRPKQSLCGVELRCPAPMTSDGFHEFNIGYRNVLEEWDIIIDGVNPVGRTNVSPVLNQPSETLLRFQLYGRMRMHRRPLGALVAVRQSVMGSSPKEICPRGVCDRRLPA